MKPARLLEVRSAPGYGCAECPFRREVNHRDSGSLGQIHDVECAVLARDIPAQPYRSAPPDWCPLRSSDVIVGLVHEAKEVA